MESPAALSVTARFALIMDGLGKAVAARIGYYPITAPMIVYIWKRLNKLNQRFQALAALIRAGKLPPERPYRPRAVVRPAAAAPDPDAAPRPWPMWRWLSTWRPGWLCWVAPSLPGHIGAACFGAGLSSLLRDPEMVALIAATPRMGNLLRPLCWALRIEGALPRRARPKRVVAEAASADLGTECDGVDSRVAEAATWVPATVKPPSVVRVEPVPDGGFFAPA
jgi:hypothetical protein